MLKLEKVESNLTEPNSSFIIINCQIFNSNPKWVANIQNQIRLTILQLLVHLSVLSAMKKTMGARASF